MAEETGSLQEPSELHSWQQLQPPQHFVPLVHCDSVQQLLPIGQQSVRYDAN